jgi:hypothetical protein
MSDMVDGFHGDEARAVENEDYDGLGEEGKMKEYTRLNGLWLLLILW